MEGLAKVPGSSQKRKPACRKMVPPLAAASQPRVRYTVCLMHALRANDHHSEELVSHTGSTMHCEVTDVTSLVFKLRMP